MLFLLSLALQSICIIPRKTASESDKTVHLTLTLESTAFIILLKAVKRAEENKAKSFKLDLINFQPSYLVQMSMSSLENTIIQYFSK